MNSLEIMTMNDTYVVVEGVAYYEKDGNYYTTSLNPDKSIDWKNATKIDIKSTSGPDITSIHSIYDSLITIKTSQRKLFNETRRVAI
jgi:hypothetical protein